MSQARNTNVIISSAVQCQVVGFSKENNHEIILELFTVEVPQCPVELEEHAGC